MNYGPQHAPRYRPALPNYTALAALANRQSLVGQEADVPPPAEPSTFDKFKAKMAEPNETLWNIPNGWILGGAAMLTGIVVLHQAGTFDKLVGGGGRKRR